MKDAHRTAYMILRKTPFRETSFIVAGISPDCGRLDFIVRGARAIGKRGFPQVGLFREYAVSFRPARRESGLATLLSLELERTHDDLAKNMDGYLSVCAMTQSILRRSQPFLEMPEFWRALSTALTRLESKTGGEPECSLALLVFLRENGLLPARVPFAEHLDALLDYACRPEARLPELPPDYLTRVSAWIRAAFDRIA